MQGKFDYFGLFRLRDVAPPEMYFCPWKPVLSPHTRNRLSATRQPELMDIGPPELGRTHRRSYSENYLKTLRKPLTEFPGPDGDNVRFLNGLVNSFFNDFLTLN